MTPPASDSPIKTRTARDLLDDALLTILETYWVQGDEVKIAPPPPILAAKAEPVHVKTVRANESSEYAGHLDAFWKEDARYVNISHVCSIGAIALSTAALYEVPLDEYSEMAERDPITKAAGLSLANTIVRSTSQWITAENYVEVITNWNDDPDTTREGVAQVFEEAADSILAASKEIWGLRDERGFELNIWFATKKAAEKFAAELDAAEKASINSAARSDDKLLEAFIDRADDLAISDESLYAETEAYLVLTVTDPLTA